MPTPYGSRGGVAFGPHELRVLSGALAIALQSDPAPEQAREYLRLAQAVDETIREGARLRSFVRADLARYRAALPGAAAGYLDQLEAALATGYLPVPADLSALRILSTRPASPPEMARRKALLRRAQAARIPQVRHPQDDRPAGRVPALRTSAVRAPAVRTSAVRTSAVPIPAVRAAEEGEQGGDGPEPTPKRKAKPSPGPAKPGPAERPGSPEPTPSRPVPTPAEVFPPRRRQPSAPSTPPPPPPSEPTEEPDTEQCATVPQRLAVPA
ncbi:hypothetical protein [Streptomyces sp. 3N207]|uniref:hypothetical protein n=1 Tax=Streptomyces sp. 3N207 TaxID=3457417 RepID=UPI003FD6920F